MGLRTVNAVMCHAHGITDRDKLILIGLAMHANDDTQIAWPSANRLSRYAGAPQIHNTRRNLKNLKDAGLIEEVTAPARSTRANHAPKAYRIVVDCNEHCHTKYCPGHYPEGAEGADYPPLYREQDGPKTKLGVSDRRPLEEKAVSDEIPRNETGVSDGRPLQEPEVSQQIPLDETGVSDEIPLEGTAVSDERPLRVSDEIPLQGTAVSYEIPLGETGVSDGITRGIPSDTQLTVNPLTPLNELTHVNVADSQANQRQPDEGPVGDEHDLPCPPDAAEYLASPGDGKTWAKQTALDGKIANASTRAAFDTWQYVFKDKPTGKFAHIPPALGRNVRSAAKEITEGDQEAAQFVVKSAMRTVVLLEIYCKTYTAQCGSKVPGDKAMTASGNILTALLEKHEWSDVQAAVKAAAAEGSHKIGQKLTNAHFHGSNGATTPSWSNGSAPAQPRKGVMSAIHEAMAMDPKMRQSTAPPAALNGDLTAHQNERIEPDDPR